MGRFRVGEIVKHQNGLRRKSLTLSMASFEHMDPADDSKRLVGFPSKLPHLGRFEKVTRSLTKLCSVEPLARVAMGVARRRTTAEHVLPASTMMSRPSRSR
jgi:hypothetical protein